MGRRALKKTPKLDFFPLRRHGNSYAQRFLVDLVSQLCCLCLLLSDFVKAPLWKLQKGLTHGIWRFPEWESIQSCTAVKEMPDQNQICEITSQFMAVLDLNPLRETKDRT